MKAVVDFLEDKTDDVYKHEIQQAIERFLTEEFSKSILEKNPNDHNRTQLQHKLLRPK